MMSRSLRIVTAVTLNTAMAFAISAIAADLPKEGTYKGTYTSFGTIKFIAVGKERVLTVWNENGSSITDGFLDHVTWHCWGTGDFVNGVGQEQGYCVGTDPAGDQIADNVQTEKHALGSKTFVAPDMWTGGTGKFAGVSGGGPVPCHPGDFKPATEGTYFLSCDMQGSYKLP
jgi:hypothetical protein